MAKSDFASLLNRLEKLRERQAEALADTEKQILALERLQAANEKEAPKRV